MDLSDRKYNPETKRVDVTGKKEAMKASQHYPIGFGRSLVLAEAVL